MFYVEHLSLTMDCDIIFKTIKNVLQGKDIDVVPATKSLRLDDERKIKSDDNKGA